MSATPGKTRHLNVFELPSFYLIDLPGYGWARTSAGERRAFRAMLEAYLTKRERLAGVVWLLDIRHPPSADDLEIQELLVGTGRPTLVVLTKGDKLPRARRAAAARDRAADLGLGVDDLLVTSSQKGDGVGDLADSIVAAVGA